MKIGRYRIAFGWAAWIQTKAPVRVWHFLFVWVFREIKPTDIDKKRQFPPGTTMEYEGQRYHYMKAGENIPHDELVKENKQCQT